MRILAALSLTNFSADSQKAVNAASLYQETHLEVKAARERLTAWIKAVEEEEDDIHALLVTMGDWV